MLLVLGPMLSSPGLDDQSVSTSSLVLSHSEPVQESGTTLASDSHWATLIMQSLDQTSGPLWSLRKTCFPRHLCSFLPLGLLWFLKKHTKENYRSPSFVCLCHRHGSGRWGWHYCALFSSPLYTVPDAGQEVNWVSWVNEADVTGYDVKSLHFPHSSKSDHCFMSYSFSPPCCDWFSLLDLFPC